MGWRDYIAHFDAPHVESMEFKESTQAPADLIPLIPLIPPRKPVNPDRAAPSEDQIKGQAEIPPTQIWDAETLEERAAIIAESCGINQDEGMARALKQMRGEL
jgi:hypothetical protein